MTRCEHELSGDKRETTCVCLKAVCHTQDALVGEAQVSRVAMTLTNTARSSQARAGRSRSIESRDARQPSSECSITAWR